MSRYAFIGAFLPFTRIFPALLFFLAYALSEKEVGASGVNDGVCGGGGAAIM